MEILSYGHLDMYLDNSLGDSKSRGADSVDLLSQGNS